MPLAVTLPHMPDVVAETGPYPRALDLRDPQQTYVQRSVNKAGLAGWEPVTMATLMALARLAPAGADVYDIGAHIGIYSAILDAVFGRGKKDLRVHAFEPTPATMAVCEEIKEYNRLGFATHPCAVSREPGTTELYISPTETSNSLNPEFRKHIATVEVPVTSVDAFTAEHSARPYLMKIDVETHEAAVLEGAMETIARTRPWIVIEFLPGCARTEELQRAMKSLATLGYGFYLLQPDMPWLRWTNSNFANWVTNPCRDWLLAPEPVTPEFDRNVRSWLRAILACEDTTNIRVADKIPYPRGWNRPYKARPSLSSLLPGRR